MDDRFGHEPPPEFRGERPDFKEKIPPAFIGEHDIVAIVVVILMCGMNLGIKLYFRSRNDQKKLQALEKENLEQQLEYLKYQINPHFFMNTLNNIHALVDIDPEKAKDTILELSKMMRFVLYEGDKKGVPLSREFDFIRHYITLMQLRYTDKVRISVDLPQEVPDRQIPPLMLITFIENAFKHGISYQHESFIDIKVAVNDKLTFTCRNSKADKPNEEKGGVGLQNVKQRLNLLYDNNYTLNIQDESDVYHVELTIPL
jgi:LytS/YehU family sensor histidine kinase